MLSLLNAGSAVSGPVGSYLLAWAFFWESLLKEELYDPHGNTPEMIGGRVWCVLGGVGEGGVVGCWLETDSAIGCRV